MSNRIRGIWDWTEDLSVRGRLCSLGYPTAAQSAGRSVDDPAEPQLCGRQEAHLCFLQPPPQCSFFRAASTLVFLIGLGEKRSTGFAVEHHLAKEEPNLGCYGMRDLLRLRQSAIGAFNFFLIFTLY